jgi:AraC family carnitine catabolism transcriptional activator
VFPESPANRPCRLAFLLLEQFSLMAFSSASEPLRVANVLAGRALYEWRLVSVDGEPVTSSNGMTSIVQDGLGPAPGADLVVAFASWDHQRVASRRVSAWLRRAAARGAWVGGVDTGSYALARAGLLDGCRATIHWELLDTFRSHFPQVTVTQDVFVVDGRRFSAAGGTACMDLMLHLINTQHGHALAAAVSDQFIYGHRRAPDASQRMALEDRLATGNGRILAAVAAMEAHIEDPLATTELARRAGVSQRELERLFTRWLGTTPGTYYRRLRLERARSLLEQTDQAITDVAVGCGFGSLAGFSRAYKARYGKPPSGARSPWR